MSAVRAFVDNLEVGEPITLDVPGHSEKLHGQITSVSRGKKGAQVSIKHGKRTSTWHLPSAALRDRSEIPT